MIRCSRRIILAFGLVVFFTFAVFAAKAIKDSGVRLAGTLLIESVIGEEDGGVGTLATIFRGYRADGAIVMEPTNLEVATTGAGCFNFRVWVPGQAAHGALRSEGVSAIRKSHRVLEALDVSKDSELTIVAAD